ncbi:MAG: VanW family protein [Anaerolineales bacterium]
MGRWLWRCLRGLGRLLYLVPLCLLIVVNLGYLAYNAHYYDRIYRGVSVLGVELGGLTPGQALQRLRETLGPERLPDVAVVAGDRATYLSMVDLGGELDLVQAVADAYALGRNGTLLPDVTMRLRLLWQGYGLAPSFQVDEAAAELALRPVARAETNPSRRSRLVVSGLQASVRAAQTGRQLDIAQTTEAIVRTVQEALGPSGWRATPRARALLHGRHSGGDGLALAPVAVPVAFTEDAPPLAEVSGAYEAVSALLASPLRLTWRTVDGEAAPGWLIDEATLASWLTLSTEANGEPRVALDPQAVAVLAAELQAQIDRPAVSGRYGYDPETQQLIEIAAEQVGFALDVPATIALINGAAFSGQHTIALPVATIAPPVSAAELRSMLPLDLLGEGTTQFVGSTAERQANIVTAARVFDGALVAAGETFSFLHLLGPVNRATGYADAWVIYADRTELGPGGGVCQVSTTCFRAAYGSGLPIVERHPHAYRVSWYEPPVGLDATVFEPAIDLRFTNDYAGPLLISVEVDEQAQTLAFRFYGHSDGRVVTLGDPETSNPQPAPEPVYEADATLAPGQQVLVERAHDGLDVLIVRTITWPNGAEQQEELRSEYAPWPARYRVGAQEAETTD